MPEVTVRSLVGLQQHIIAPPHSYIADEPVEFDGDDLGGSPYELLLGALGSCTNMTLLGYARHKGWSLRGVETRLVHNRVYGEDCRRCDEEGQHLESIERHVTLHGVLTPQQVETLASVARRCPVHKSVSRGLDVRDTVITAV